ncbi:MAG TPA: GDP-mannose 4,6-dehydratase, partial [Pirellulales bacterium]|nr:GDP-mannose 4,6-dehydratase [Pirellulales bacterium]
DNFNDFYDPAIKRQNTSPFVENHRVTVVEGDICDVEAVRQLFVKCRFSHVVHLAAYAGVRASMADPIRYEQTNVGGTLALLEAARQFPVERFLLISSSTVYGRSAVAPFAEDAPLGRPLSPYGASKRAAETFGMMYFQLYNVPIVCLRPFSVYGPRLRPDLVLSIWTEAIATGQPLPLFGDGSVRRDFTHVGDICGGMLAALERPNLAGEAINLGHDQPMELQKVITTLERMLGAKAVIDCQPEKPGEMPLTHADLSKARRLLGYEPRVSFDEGMRDFVEWYRQRSWERTG